MEVGVLTGNPVGILVREVLHALVGDEVVLHPEPFPGVIDPHVRVGGIAIHVPPRARDTAVAHEIGHLVGALRRQRPEIPLHVLAAQCGIGKTLLGVDEVGELHGVPHEEHRGVVAHHVVVALVGVELQGEAAHVPPGVGGAQLTGNGGESGQCPARGSRLQEGRLGVLAHVTGDGELTEGPRSLGVWAAFRNALPVETGELLHQGNVVKHERTVRADGQGLLVRGSRLTGFGGGGNLGIKCHDGVLPSLGRSIAAHARCGDVPPP